MLRQWLHFWSCSVVDAVAPHMAHVLGAAGAVSLMVVEEGEG